MLHLRMSVVRHRARTEAPSSLRIAASQFLARHLIPPLSPPNTKFVAKHVALRSLPPLCNALQSLAAARAETSDRPPTRKTNMGCYDLAASWPPSGALRGLCAAHQAISRTKLADHYFPHCPLGCGALAAHRSGQCHSRILTLTQRTRYQTSRRRSLAITPRGLIQPCGP